MYAERYVSKRRVAAKKFVAAQTGNRHFESQFTRGFADEPRVEPVDCGLVHGLENFGQIVSKLSLRHKTRGMPRAILRRNLCRDRGLVIFPAAEFLESQGHRLDVLLTR